MAVTPILFPLMVVAAICDSFALVTTFPAMVAALPMLVTSPVRLAFVVTVAALPLTFPVTLPVRLPVNPVAVSIPVDGTKDSFVEESFVA